MSAQPYTLLLVESSTIAESIGKLQIPWLEVIATDGYCWSPVFDTEKLHLKTKAVPEKRKLRKMIREKAAWSPRVIIAADSDPSGDFIAWTLCRHLEQVSLMRTTLNHIGEIPIRNRLESATPLVPDMLRHKLTLRYLFRHLWNQNFGRKDPADTVLRTLYHSRQAFTTFADKSGLIHNSNKPVKLSRDKKISIDDGIEDYHLTAPPSTFTILELAENINGFDQRSQLLFKLFTEKLHGRNLNLISYPRSSVNGYYHSTWQKIETQWIQHNSLDALKPSSIREIIPDHNPHESIFPATLQDTPEQLAGLITSDLFYLYEVIYRRFLKSITYSRSLSFSAGKLPGIKFTSTDSDNIKQPNWLRPMWTVSSLGKRLCDIGVCRPSNYGQKLDHWIGEGKLNLDGPLLEIGNNLQQPTDADRKRFELIINAKSIVDKGLTVNKMKDLFRNF